MKVFTPDSPYYSPLTKNTMDSLFTRLFTPFTCGMSSTLLVERGSGGGKSLTDFMIRHVDDLGTRNRIPVTSSTHRYVILEPDEIEGRSASAFFRHVFKCTYDADDFGEVPKTISDMKSLVRKIIQTRELVFCIRGANFMEYVDERSWRKFTSLWVHSGRVHYFFVLYGDNLTDVLAGPLAGVRDVAGQEVVPFGSVSNMDVEYSIHRWGYMLEYSFSKKEIEEIRRVSRGYPALIKACCFAVVRRKGPGNLTGDRHVSLLLRKLSGNWKKIGISPDDVSRILSVQEYVVFSSLVRNLGSILSQDDIARIVWPIGTDRNFSSHAIVQIISRIRKKIAAADIKQIEIRSIYGEGYALYVIETDNGITR